MKLPILTGLNKTTRKERVSIRLHTKTGYHVLRIGPKFYQQFLYGCVAAPRFRYGTGPLFGPFLDIENEDFTRDAA